jgi:hypothetical protein
MGEKGISVCIRRENERSSMAFISPLPCTLLPFSLPFSPPSHHLPSASNLPAAVYVDFVQTIYSVDEDEKDISVCVELSNTTGPLSDPIWLSVASSNGSAASKCNFH